MLVGGPRRLRQELEPVPQTSKGLNMRDRGTLPRRGAVVKRVPRAGRQLGASQSRSFHQTPRFECGGWLAKRAEFDVA